MPRVGENVNEQIQRPLSSSRTIKQVDLLHPTWAAVYIGGMTLVIWLCSYGEKWLTYHHARQHIDLHDTPTPTPLSSCLHATPPPALCRFIVLRTCFHTGAGLRLPNFWQYEWRHCDAATTCCPWSHHLNFQNMMRDFLLCTYPNIWFPKRKPVRLLRCTDSTPQSPFNII